MTKPLITAYDWAPDEGRGLVRDMRVRWALEEVGQPYDVRYLSWGEQKEPAHRARNPFGQVPAYEEDGLVLFESGAIVLHIAERWPGLWPADPAGRARAIEWSSPRSTPLAGGLGPGDRQGDRRQGELARDRWPSVLERLRMRLGELSRALGDEDWLDGEFSAGDLLMVQVLRHVGDPATLAEHPNLEAYVARGMNRPAFKRALEALQAGQTGQPPADWPH